MPELTKGWLPVAIDLDSQPALITEAAVRWLEFGSASFSEPFLDNTAEKLRRESPPARELATDLDVMVRAASRLPPVTPAGFIFHISRCGSTLIANCLKTAEGVAVVSESRAATCLLLRYSEPVEPYLAGRWTRVRRTLLDSLFRLMAGCRTGEPERLVIKFASINILMMSLVRSYWPETPCVVVVRDPAEVMVANLRGGGWMSLKDSPEAARERFAWEDTAESIAAMPVEQFAARVIGGYMEAALSSVDEDCMIVDYEDLNPARMSEIAAFLQIGLPSDPKRIEKAMRVYAKDPQGSRQYQDDRMVKQRLITRETKAAAQQWAMVPYSRLRSI